MGRLNRSSLYGDGVGLEDTGHLYRQEPPWAQERDHTQPLGLVRGVVGVVLCSAFFECHGDVYLRG